MLKSSVNLQVEGDGCIVFSLNSNKLKLLIELARLVFIGISDTYQYNKIKV